MKNLIALLLFSLVVFLTSNQSFSAIDNEQGVEIVLDVNSPPDIQFDVIETKQKTFPVKLLYLGEFLDNEALSNPGKIINTESYLYYVSLRLENPHYFIAYGLRSTCVKDRSKYN